MANKKELQSISDFTHYLFVLKTILRFKDMPGFEDMTPERWDSVSEHTHRMALLAVMLESHLEDKNKLDLLKTLKMVLIHDIVELVANDYSPMGGGKGGHAFDANAFQDKYERETVAAKHIFSKLPEALGDEFTSLFEEYINTKAKPEAATKEGRFAYALDKVEAFIQVMDWRAVKKDWPKEHYEKSVAYMREWTNYDEGLKTFGDILVAEAEKLVKS